MPMSIYTALLLFSFIILIYWIITELFTILFRFTGLPDERARFQVISLLTGCGYTTRESELFISNRSRRRLARITMLFGYVFNITIVSAFINVFLSLKLSQVEHYYAGALIEQSQLKGVSVGGAQVSEKHAGFLINTGNATAADFLQLMKLVQDTVMEKFGVQMENEVRIVGNDP